MPFCIDNKRADCFKWKRNSVRMCHVLAVLVRTRCSTVDRNIVAVADRRLWDKNDSPAATTSNLFQHLLQKGLISFRAVLWENRGHAISIDILPQVLRSF